MLQDHISLEYDAIILKAVIDLYLTNFDYNSPKASIFDKKSIFFSHVWQCKIRKKGVPIYRHFFVRNKSCMIDEDFFHHSEFHSIYQDSKLSEPVACFAKLVETGLRVDWAEQYVL